MKISFAGMKTQVPDGWQDESTITFSMPAQPGIDVPLALNPRVPDSAANLVITWEHAGELGAQEYLDQRLAQLSEQLPGFTVAERGDAGDAQEPIPWAEFSLVAKVAVTQLLLVKRAGDRVFVITGTSLTPSFAAAKDQFLSAARQLAPE
jgi:hypothetical protein